MTSAPDMSASIIPRSDQLNAEDLLSGPRTVTITGVTRGTVEQPVDIVTAEYGPGRPYKPSKTMRRILVMAWGTNTSDYIGRRITIYRDPDIRFGPDRVGGIRISHLSHIDKRLEIALTVTRGRRASFTVEPLPDAPPLKEVQNKPPPREEGVSFTPERRRKGLNMMFALFGEADVAKDNREDRLIVTSDIIGQPIASSSDLTDPQLYSLVNTLREWKDTGKLGQEVTDSLNRYALRQMEAEDSAADQDEAADA